MSAVPFSSNRTEFLANYDGVYEHSPWIAIDVWPGVNDGSICSLDDLASAMKTVVDNAPHSKKIELIRAHPELAGKAAIVNALTKQSRKEQSLAGLDQCTPEEFQHFQNLNCAYAVKFEFPFVIAVAGLTRQEILSAFEIRLQNSPGAEFETALAEIHKIARFRLNRLSD